MLSGKRNTGKYGFQFYRSLATLRYPILSLSKIPDFPLSYPSIHSFVDPFTHPLIKIFIRPVHPLSSLSTFPHTNYAVLSASVLHILQAL